MMKTAIPKTLFLIACLLSVVPVKAQLTFGIPVASLSTNGSSLVPVIGSLTNLNSSNSLFLNGIQVGVGNNPSNLVSGDTNAFFGNVPGILLPGEVYQDVFLNLAIDPATPPGTYPVTVTLLGGVDMTSTNVLGTKGFNLVLSSPRLSIAASGTNAVFGWSAPPGGFHLQSTTNLVPGDWKNETDTAPAGTSQIQQILPAPGAVKYFRLQYP